jgi:hypothetical protein
MRLALPLALALVAAAGPAVGGHHTVASTYDATRAVTLTGTITSVQWQNPHVVYQLAVKDAAGAAVDWAIESRHLQGMRHDGLEMDRIKPGDTVTMRVMLALDGSRRAATVSVTLADGQTIRVCTVTNNQCP